MQDVVARYPGRVRFVSENWGTSKLAERYGVEKYPVVFVNDVLFAQPNDFGWFGAKGKYTPWREPANHERFKSDLTKMIELALADPKAASAAPVTRALNESEIAALPELTMQSLQGQSIALAGLKGKVVIVEFWATWCPPCLSTLNWLGGVQKQYGDRLVIVAIALESPPEDVRKLTSSLNLPVNWVLGSESLAAPFGSLSGVPKMFIFDQTGKTNAIFYGATDDLHARVGKVLSGLVK